MNEQETHEAVIKLARRELEDHERINCWFRPEFVRALIDRLEAAHNREIDVLRQRCTELNAEVAAKDVVIKRLNDALAEEQRRKMATTEKSSAVGDCAKLREAAETARLFVTNCNTPLTTPLEGCGMSRAEVMNIIDTALAAPPRNCDKYANHNDAKKAFEAFVRKQGKLGFFNPYTEAFKWLFAPATEKEGGNDGK